MGVSHVLCRFVSKVLGLSFRTVSYARCDRDVYVEATGTRHAGRYRAFTSAHSVIVSQVTTHPSDGMGLAGGDSCTGAIKRCAGRVLLAG